MSFTTEAINFRGEFGDTPLHWACILPSTQSVKLTGLLLDAGALMDRATFHTCQLPGCIHATDIMPAHTTPEEWAVIVDNIERLLALERRDPLHNTTASTSSRTMKLLTFAAQYRSIRCLRHLCETREDSKLNNFNDQGFSPFYFAIRPDVFGHRPDVFGHILRYDASFPCNAQTSAPFIARQLEVMDMILKGGSKMRVHTQDLFNCIHVTAAQGEPDILKHLLHVGGNEMINQPSAYGWTPLKDAITTGNLEAFDLLLENGADLRKVWKNYYPLHVCSMFQGAKAVEMAKKLIEQGHNLEAHSNIDQTPLSMASHYGHLKLIKLFVSHGARLLDIQHVGLSSLGYAIRSRHIPAVALLYLNFREQNLPLMAGKGVWIFHLIQDMRVDIFLPGKYTSALQYLLMPGAHSPGTSITHTSVPRQKQFTVLGCCDVPFSKTSLAIIDILLRHYEYRLKIKANWYLGLTYPNHRYDSGLHWAVRMTNIEVVKRILAARRNERLLFKPDLRYLTELACSQLVQGSSHVGSPEQRVELTRYVMNKQIEEFRLLQEGRIEKTAFPLLRQLWLLYYNIYGRLEQAQYERVLEWQLENGQFADLRFLEFSHWHYFRFSPYIFPYATLWAILLPLLIYYADVAQDPNTETSPMNIACVTLTVLLVIPISAY